MDEVQMRQALERIAGGDEPRPVGEHWFSDKRHSKHNKCTHGIWMYETCGNCISEYAATAIRSLAPPAAGPLPSDKSEA